MTWDVRLSKQAERALERIAAPDRDRIEAALRDMLRDPLAGDTKPLKGQHHGAYRRRVGSWRIIFSLKRDIRTAIVADIVRRTSTTYLPGGEDRRGNRAMIRRR